MNFLNEAQRFNNAAKFAASFYFGFLAVLKKTYFDGCHLAQFFQQVQEAQCPSAMIVINQDAHCA